MVSVEIGAGVERLYQSFVLVLKELLLSDEILWLILSIAMKF